MNSPFTGKEMPVVKVSRSMHFRKDEFTIMFHCYQCEDMGEQFEDEKFAQLNYLQVVNQYREKYNIPFPDQIIAIREKYGLSAAKMSDILGFGVNIYRQYEGGEVPSQSNARLIQLAADPHEFKKLVRYAPSLEQKTIEKIHATIDNLLQEEKRHKSITVWEHFLMGDRLPGCLTGYKATDYGKFSEMVKFFTQQFEPWKTQLNKLLFYADFTMFQETGWSISGLQYRAIPLGPVPDNFNSLFEYLVNRGEVEINYISFPDGGIGEQFKALPQRPFHPDLFNETELRILNQVSGRFKNIPTSEIIAISHKEKAWLDNHQEKRLIDYRYGFELN